MEPFIFKGKYITKNDLMNNTITLDFNFLCSSGPYSLQEYQFIEYIIENDYLPHASEKIETLLITESLAQKSITGTSTLYTLLKQKNYNFENIVDMLVYEKSNIEYDLDIIFELLDLYPDKFKFYSDMMFCQTDDNIIILIKKLITHEYKFADSNIGVISKYIGLEFIIKMLRNTYYQFTFTLITRLLDNFNKNNITEINLLINIMIEYDINPDIYVLLIYAKRLNNINLLNFVINYPIPDISLDTERTKFYKAIKEHNLEDVYLKISLK